MEVDICTSSNSKVLSTSSRKKIPEPHLGAQHNLVEFWGNLMKNGKVRSTPPRRRPPAKAATDKHPTTSAHSTISQKLTSYSIFFLNDIIKSWQVTGTRWVTINIISWYNDKPHHWTSKILETYKVIPDNGSESIWCLHDCELCVLHCTHIKLSEPLSFLSSHFWMCKA